MTPEGWQIRVRGHLGPEWQEWFEGLTVTNVEHGEATLTGTLADQAALFGVLLKIRDLGLPLLELTRTSVDSAPAESTAATP